MASTKSRNAHIAKVRQSVRRLMDRMTIPAVASQRALIERIANDDGYLREAPLPELERIRLALRGLIRYSVDDANRRVVITDLTDPVTQRAEGLPFDMREDYEDYRLKVNRYINEHLEDGAIAKLRHNRPLTADDWSELEQVFTERLGTNAEYEEAFRDESFGMTVRRIAKLDHAAAQEAFAGFIAAHTLNGDQIAFMNRVIAYVEQNGTIDMADLIKPPFDRPMPLIRLFGGNTAVLSDLADSIRRMNANAMAPAA